MKKEFYASVVLLLIFISCTAWYREVPRSFVHTDRNADSTGMPVSSKKASCLLGNGTTEK
jgi:hypothetical protein